MLSLQVKNTLTIDSREVADMVGKRHTDLIRDIRKYEDFLTNAKMRSLDFFVPSTYIDGKGEERPNYEVTKKGCEFIAHKLTGQKGTLFTASYINRFHEMEKALSGGPMDVAKMLNQQVNIVLGEVENLNGRVESLENNMTVDFGQQRRLQNKANSRAVNVLGGADSPSYKNRSIRSKVYSAIWRDYKDYFMLGSYRDTSRVDFDKAMEYLDGWQAQGKLLREIEQCNSQIDIREVM